MGTGGQRRASERLQALAQAVLDRVACRLAGGLRVVVSGAGAVCALAGAGLVLRGACELAGAPTRARVSSALSPVSVICSNDGWRRFMNKI